ncbi:hypothetical protein CHGG_06530 [Chaetomium globosum CBS 148.51]|uniref:NCT transcriptional regulatory complex subunit B n=1 Tax=Chaetomium globosum (strain ATCC 6205 / CBS 148.51 / DSM 1962 / NBRC 6347 / NRRL 1970) TaxID=306901 RepID=Q2H485_CHAGB|nr:uncharacterized protein CHGG_06530 [Chaetomium globosum CBS 148.51]EAQ89911.1 hypothetical protein CHGG_06530 [Chaetomium globosum CBS 148.51]
MSDHEFGASLFSLFVSYAFNPPSSTSYLDMPEWLPIFLRQTGTGSYSTWLAAQGTMISRCRKWPSIFKQRHWQPRVTWIYADILQATVQKIVGEILSGSSGIAFSKEARDVLIECCVEFITLISSEANDISEKEAKKTIACDHIIKALDQLGFTDYIPAVLEAAAEHKEVQKVGREKKANKLEQSGLSLEELERLQQEQFAAAAARHG